MSEQSKNAKRSKNKKGTAEKRGEKRGWIELV